MGAKGTVDIEIELKGKGRVDSSGAGWDDYEWSASHPSKLQVALTATDPGVDASRFAGLGGGSEAESGDDEDWEAEWDDKFDAGEGDEACETRVTMARMQDPRMQGTMGAVTAGMAKMNSGELDLGPASRRGRPPRATASTVATRGRASNRRPGTATRHLRTAGHRPWELI